MARLSLMAALGVVFLVLAGVIPTGQLVLLVLASFPVCASLMMYGPWWALGVFLITAALGNILFPGVSGVAYAVFFGYYPILKSVLERMHNIAWMWVLKYAVYTVIFVFYWFLAGTMLDTMQPWFILYLIGCAAFAVYDWAYSLLIRFYIEKIARYFP